MSFSSRVIAEPAPPVSAPVRHLGLMIWSLPILFSFFCFLVSLRSGPAGPAMVNSHVHENLHAVVAELPDLLEPETFARVGATPFVHTALNLPVAGEHRFPMRVEAWKSTPFHVGKIAVKAREDVKLSAVTPHAGGQRATNESNLHRTAQAAGRMVFSETRRFRKAKAVGATSIMGDNVKILLAGIEPLPPNAMCKRLDGVTQSCSERAAHRLAILLQARAVSCELSGPLASGVYLGRCMADRIDIAGDLLRQKLTQRNAMTLAAAHP